MSHSMLVEAGRFHNQVGQEQNSLDLRMDPFTEWSPKDYLADFYTGEVAPDEKEALMFYTSVLGKIVERNRRLNPAKNPKIPVLLEYGVGPTVHRAIAAEPYVQEIHMADYIGGNVDEIQKWIARRNGENEINTDIHDWRNYTEFVINRETGRMVQSDQINARENRTRSKIKLLFKETDARDPNPLGINSRGIYPVVATFFCADSATDSKDEWEQMMRNIGSLVAPGGDFIVGALRGSKRYKAGRKYFPSANIYENDLYDVLRLDFSIQNEHIVVRSLREHRDKGYEGILLAHARKSHIARK